MRLFRFDVRVRRTSDPGMLWVLVLVKGHGFGISLKARTVRSRSRGKPARTYSAANDCGKLGGGPIGTVATRFERSKRAMKTSMIGKKATRSDVFDVATITDLRTDVRTSSNYICRLIA